MKFIVCAALAAVSLAYASGPVAVYALLDKVTLEPNADKPERIRIDGVFSTAADATSGSYSAPQRGYLYLALPHDNADLVRREWSDLKSIAGTRQVVSVGSSWTSRVRVRRADESPGSPDEYPIGNGLAKVNPDHPRAKALLDYSNR
ncbi:MAG TPA: hypothetical protein VKB88_45985 [Bryobacteraceae bacterium]|nr:hypothetical protein [Bryobacteraceae bacterium]